MSQKCAMCWPRPWQLAAILDCHSQHCHAVADHQLIWMTSGGLDSQHNTTQRQQEPWADCNSAMPCHVLGRCSRPAIQQIPAYVPGSKPSMLGCHDNTQAQGVPSTHSHHVERAGVFGLMFTRGAAATASRRYCLHLVLVHWLMPTFLEYWQLWSLSTQAEGLLAQSGCVVPPSPPPPPLPGAHPPYRQFGAAVSMSRLVRDLAVKVACCNKHMASCNQSQLSRTSHNALNYGSEGAAGRHTAAALAHGAAIDSRHQANIAMARIGILPQRQRAAPAAWGL